jgi:hypothetical protein
MGIIRTETHNYIHISISTEDEIFVSWEFLQTIKDLFYPNAVFDHKFKTFERNYSHCFYFFQWSS